MKWAVFVYLQFFGRRFMPIQPLTRDWIARVPCAVLDLIYCVLGGNDTCTRWNGAPCLNFIFTAWIHRLYILPGVLSFCFIKIDFFEVWTENYIWLLVCAFTLFIAGKTVWAGGMLSHTSVEVRISRCKKKRNQGGDIKTRPNRIEKILFVLKIIYSFLCWSCAFILLFLSLQMACLFQQQKTHFQRGTTGAATHFVTTLVPLHRTQDSVMCL